MEMIEVLQRLTLDINNLHSHMHRVQFDLSTLLGDVNSAYLQTSDDSLNTSFQAQHDEKISLIHSLSRLCDAIGLLLAPMMYQHVQAVNKLAKKVMLDPKHIDDASGFDTVNMVVCLNPLLTFLKSCSTAGSPVNAVENKNKTSPHDFRNISKLFILGRW